MDANKFWETKRKICYSYKSCSEGCPLWSADSRPVCLGTRDHIEKGTPIMERWLADHGEPVEKPKLDVEALAEFSKAFANLCDTYAECIGCPFKEEVRKCPGIDAMTAEDWQTAIDVVKEWHCNRSEEGSQDVNETFTVTLKPTEGMTEFLEYLRECSTAISIGFLMRQIIFRGKRTDNGEWAEGFYIVIGNPFTKDGLPMRHCIAVDKTCFYYEVDSATVGQFTGLLDKKRAKIFEGDILEIKHMGSWVICFCDGSFMALPRTADRRLTADDIADQAMIVGNIHDNPELGKEERK